MATQPFEFSLQPAVDKSIFLRDQCAEELAGIQSQIAFAELHLTELKDLHRQAVQLLKAESDNHRRTMTAGAKAYELIDGARDLQVVQKNVATRAADVLKQRQLIDLLHVRLDVKKEELLEKMEQVKAYEKLRERAAEEHGKKQKRIEEMQVDEQALEQFERQRQVQRKI